LLRQAAIQRDTVGVRDRNETAPVSHGPHPKSLRRSADFWIIPLARSGPVWDQDRERRGTPAVSFKERSTWCAEAAEAPPGYTSAPAYSGWYGCSWPPLPGPRNSECAGL